MKNPSLIAATVTSLTLLPGTPSCLAQENSATKTSAYQSSVAQDQLRAQTLRLKQDMLRMLEEFKRNPAASAEIAQAQAAIEKLDALSEKEMLAVIQSLREASRLDSADAAKSKMVAASNNQKQIQSTLRALSDKLALYKDEASIQARLNDLILRQLANQRQARHLSDGTVRDFRIKTVFPVAVSEQEAMKTEIHLLMETLKKLSANPSGTARQTFASMAGIGNFGQIEAFAVAAATALSSKDYAGAIANEGKVVDGLQRMVQLLNQAKSREERIQAAAVKVKELASLQNQLANNTISTPVYAMGNISDRQQQITDKITAVEKEISQISPQAGSPLAAAKKTTEEIDQTLKSEGFRKNEVNKAPVIESQKGAANKLDAVAKLLQNEAERLAGTAPGLGAGESPDSKAMQAINEAAQNVMKAQQNIGVASQLMNNPSAVGAAKSEMDGAQGALKAAMDAIKGAGDAVPKTVGDDLTGADKEVAGTKAQTGTEADQGKARFGLNRAGAKADAALKGLQDAANALAAKAAAGQPGKGLAGKGKGGKGQSGGPAGGPFDGKVAQGGGSPGSTKAEDTGFSALSEISEKDRLALSLLQREKSPPEYSVMVQQYLKNLADGEMPGQP